MNQSPARVEERELRGHHVLLMFIAFFGCIIIVNVTMGIIASKTWTGLVVKNTYVASQEFNDGLLAAKKQAALGFRVKIAYEQNQFVFSLEDRNQKLVPIRDLKVKVGRPAFEQKDQVVSEFESRQGRYVAKVKLAPGPWDVVVTGQTDSGPYRIETRLAVQDLSPAAD